jgi:ketosteroid isomerase-like protein
MSEENVEVVRTPLRTRDRSSRTLDQRIALRLPRVAAACFRWVGKLPPSSRVRRASLSRGARIGAEAYNRRDLDAVVIAYHPELEYRPAQAWVEAGFFDECYRGPEGYRRYVASTAEVFGSEVFFKPVELIDLGDRIVVLANAPMRAQASGIPLTERFAYVATVKDGRVIRLQEYYDYTEALAAVGLSM